MHIYTESQAIISLCLFPSLVIWSGEEKDRQTFLLRLLFLLPNSAEALLDLVSRAFPSAASAMTLVTASSPLSGATWNGSQLDGVPTGGLCDVNDLL